GPPERAFPVATAPIAPEPLVPVISIPAKLKTEIDAATLWERFAVTLTLESADEAKARQISAVPICAFERWTRTQVRLPPVTPVTVVPAELPSVAINASSSSFPAVVEKDWLLIWLLEVDESPVATASMVIAPQHRTGCMKTWHMKKVTRNLVKSFILLL